MEELKPCKYCGTNPIEGAIDWYDDDGNWTSTTNRVRCPNPDCPVRPCAQAINDRARARKVWNEKAGESHD